mgnify:FL=1
MHIWFPVIEAKSGSDVYFRELANALRARGHEATLTCLPMYLEPLADLGRFIRVPPRVELVHTNSWNGFAFSRSGLPLVTTVHHWVHDPILDPYKSVLQRFYHASAIKWYEQRSIAAADRVCTVSAFTAAVLRKVFPGLEPTVIHNGVDTDRFCPGDNGPEDTRGTVFNLLFVGSPDKRKGFDLLAPIMAKLGDDYRLTCITQRDHQMPPADNIRCLSGVNHERLISEFRQCDAFLFPTRYEGFGYVVAEAMACGKPVVSTNCSAIPEIVTHDVDGLLANPDDIDAYVDHIRTLRGDRGRVRTFGGNARRRIVEDFSLDVMIDQYVALYAGILERS